MTVSDRSAGRGEGSPGRNSLCPCGSGRKFKVCCGRIGAAPAASVRSDVRNELQELLQLLRRDQAPLAEAKLRTLLVDQPGRGELWHLLGIALRQQRRPCLDELAKAAALSSGDPELYVNLGNEYARLNRHAAALHSYERALELRPGFVEAHLNLGEAQLAIEQPAAARAQFQCTLDAEPGNTRAQYGIARSYAACGDGQAAEVAFRLVLARVEWPEAYNSLGNLLRSMGRIEEALGVYQRALELAPDLAEVHSNLAVALRLDGQHELAQASCQRALELNPNLVPALITWAEAHADQGLFDASEARYRQAISITPDSPEAWAGIGRLRRMSQGDATWFESVSRLTGQPLAARQESLLRYAMGKYLDEVADYSAAFENFRRANDLDRALHAPYDPSIAHTSLDAIIRRYQDPWNPTALGAADPSECAVLIVGMPRSGTTLAEQILAAHPAVSGAGELMYWSQHAAQASDVEGHRRLGTDYLQQIRRRAGDARRVIDKMPANFLHLGLIHAALPRARIIHLQRDPVDTCLSIYFQHFEGFHSYANDLEDLAHYYREYRRLMAHWRAALPAGIMLEVSYAALVDDPERYSRQMLAFIDLPWDARCLHFHQQQRTVLSASKWQVRQPISRHSLERWRHYEDYLGPLQSLWNEVAIAEGAP